MLCTLANKFRAVFPAPFGAEKWKYFCVVALHRGAFNHKCGQWSFVILCSHSILCSWWGIFCWSSLQTNPTHMPLQNQSKFGPGSFYLHKFKYYHNENETADFFARSSEAQLIRPIWNLKKLKVIFWKHTWPFSDQLAYESQISVVGHVFFAFIVEEFKLFSCSPPMPLPFWILVFQCFF